MPHYYRIAYKTAKKSTHRNHLLGAIVVKGGAIISSAANNQKWKGHAEQRALRPNEDYVGAVLYVVRANGGISRPCEQCMQAIREAGIKKVYYVDENRMFACEKMN